jgi:peptidoglycan/LPS O-acetylase OafA/YrhL
VLFGGTRILFYLAEPALLAAWSLPLLAATIVSTVTVSLVLAYISWRWVERPFIALGRRRGSRPPEAAFNNLETRPL